MVNNIILRLDNKSNGTVRVDDVKIFEVIVVFHFITHPPPSLSPPPPPPCESYYELPPTLVPIQYVLSALVTKNYS